MRRTPFHRRPHLPRGFVGALLALCLAIVAPALAKSESSSPGDAPQATSPFAARWAEIDKLLQIDLISQAADKVDELIAIAQRGGDDACWARALARGAQIANRLHGASASVSYLREKPWPAGAEQRALVSSFYALALRNDLLRSRSEVAARPRFDDGRAPSELPQALWTTEQYATEARRACFETLARGAALGALPPTEASFWVEPDDSPAPVRRTLRDAVTHACVQLLADDTFWSPTERDSELDLERPALARSAALEAPRLPLASGEHPLISALAALAGLETWHRDEGRREAALEAHLQQIQLLAGRAAPDEKLRLANDLEAYLEPLRDLPWWSAGQAARARLLLETDEPGHLLAADAAARAGRDAWPESFGGALCRAVAAELEAPALRLSTLLGAAVGSPAIVVENRNLPELSFRAYPLDLRRHLVESESVDQIGSSEVDDLLAHQTPLAAWRSDLPATPDLELHTTTLVPPLERPGAYVLLASPQPTFTGPQSEVRAALLVLGDLALVSRRTAADEVEILALSGASGEPLANARVRLWLRAWQSRVARVVEERTTGADGTVRFPLSKDEVPFVTAERDGEVALLRDLGYPADRERDEEPTRALIYTDRSVYRPGQTLHWKVLAYRRATGPEGVRSLTGATLTLRLTDPRGQAVATRTLTTNSFGTAAGELVLPNGRSLGAWGLTVQGPGDPSRDLGWRGVEVEEYKRPTFELSFLAPERPLLLGRPARLRARAAYFFGAPVARGEARWRIVRTPSSTTQGWRYAGESRTVPRRIASGVAALAPDGILEIPFTPEPGRISATAPRSYDFTLTLEVTDAGGETHQAERTFVAGPVTLRVEIVRERGFLSALQPAAVKAVLRDLNGAPRNGTGSWSLRELIPGDADDAPTAGSEEEGEDGSWRRTAGGWEAPAQDDMESPGEGALFRWREGLQRAEGSARHGRNGEAVLSLPGLPAGAYRLTYTTHDADGTPIVARRDLWVAGPRSRIALPGVPAILRAERPSIEAGGTIRLLAGSGSPGQACFFEIWQGGALRERRLLRGGVQPRWIEVPVRESDRGGLAFRLFLLRGHRLYDLEERVDVPWRRELDVQLATFRDRLRPGERETWQIRVRAPRGQAPEAAAAEILAVMNDRSLESLRPYELPDPLALYPVRASSAPVDASFREVQESWWRGPNPQRSPLPTRRPGRLIGLEPWQDPAGSWSSGELTFDGRRAYQSMTVRAVGPSLDARPVAMAATISAARRERPLLEVPPDLTSGSPQGERPDMVAVRADFSELAVWRPQLLTGGDGTATIEFTVPDSATAWSVWLQAVTRDLRSGTLHRDLVTRRELLVRPSLPRFLLNVSHK